MVYALVATTLLSQVAIALGIVTYGVMHIILLIRAKRNRALSNFRLAILNAVMDLGKSTKQFVGFVILLRLILLPVAAYLENPRAHLAEDGLQAVIASDKRIRNRVDMARFRRGGRCNM